MSYPSDSFGGSTVRACQLCPPGHYCQQRGRAEPSGQCAEGYYCPEGQSSERPQQHVCSVGHYCEKVIHLVLVLKKLSVSAAEYCMWCLCMSLPSQLCFFFCHDKCIAIVPVFFLFLDCLSLLVCCVGFSPKCCFCTLVIPDDARYSLDIKSNKINLMVASGQCQTDSLPSRQLPAQTRPGQLWDMPCRFLLPRSR